MRRHIIKKEVIGLNTITLKDLIGESKANEILSIVKDEINNGFRLACIGKQGTGKSVLLRTLIGELGNFKENQTCDGVVELRDMKFVTSKACKYFTFEAADTVEMLEKLLKESGKEVMEPCVVLVCSIHNGKRYISSIDEIVIEDGRNSIINLMTMK